MLKNTTERNTLEYVKKKRVGFSHGQSNKTNWRSGEGVNVRGTHVVRTRRHVRERHCAHVIIATDLYLENIVKPRTGGENSAISEVRNERNDRLIGSLCGSYGSIIDKSIGVGVGLGTNRFFND